MSPEPPISGIVVAGGQSRRLGHDKRRLRLWGTAGPTLLEHTLAVIAPLCAELVVVLNDPESWPHLPARTVPDVFADGGALGGIYAGLQAAAHPAALVVAADMPLLNPALLRWMLTQPRTADVLAPPTQTPERISSYPSVEPLHAIYRRDTCLPPMRAALQRGTRRISDVLAAVRVGMLDPADLARYDPHNHSACNLNTPADLERVRRILAHCADAVQ